jgi:hypothetical protein
LIRGRLSKLLWGISCRQNTGRLSQMPSVADSLLFPPEGSRALGARTAWSCLGETHGSFVQAREGVKAMERLFRNAIKRQKVGVSSPQPCVSA